VCHFGISIGCQFRGNMADDDAVTDQVLLDDMPPAPLALSTT
jgi:hypothetical protein